MGAKVGLDCKAYRNTASYASPSWNEITNVKDATLNLETGEADGATRGANGWAETVATLKDASYEFDLQADTNEDDIAVFMAAFVARTPIEMAIMDGPIVTAGSQGLRATMAVMSCTRNEPLQDVVTYSITVKPTPADNQPEWLIVGS